MYFYLVCCSVTVCKTTPLKVEVSLLPVVNSSAIHSVRIDDAQSPDFPVFLTLGFSLQYHTVTLCHPFGRGLVL